MDRGGRIVEQREIVVGTFTRSLVLAVARTTGRFDAAGLSVVERSVASSSAQFASLESGEYDLVLTGPDNVIAYRFVHGNPLGRVMPVGVLAGVDRGLGLGLWAAPGADLEPGRGVRLGVDVAGSGFTFLAYDLLERVGLPPGSYEVLPLGATPRRVESLIDGSCDVTILNAGNELRARRAGCGLVAGVSDYAPYLGTVLAALEGGGDSVRESRRRFREAFVETISEILAGRRRAEMVRAAQELLGLSAPDAEEHYAVCVSGDHGLVGGGTVPRDALAAVLDLRRRYAPSPEIADYARVLDELADAKPA